MPTDDQRRAYAGALAKAQAAWTDEAPVYSRAPEVTAVAEVLGLDPGELDWHVEAKHGWEPHDTGYEDAVWAAAECGDPEHLVMARAWGRPDVPDGDGLVMPLRQVRVQRRRERRRH